MKYQKKFVLYLPFWCGTFTILSTYAFAPSSSALPPPTGCINFLTW